MNTCYILDASAFINKFYLNSDYNYTVPEVTAEIKDFESRILYDSAVSEEKLIVKDVTPQYLNKIEKIISESGDILRLSIPDKKLIALALMLNDEGRNVKVITDDYTIQNTLKIINIPYSGIITKGISEIYNWKKVCRGCRKEFEDNYPFEDCDICGSQIFKKRIKVNK